MGYVLTPTFRVSFPNVFEPKLNNLSGKMEYSVLALFAKGENMKVIEQEMLRAVKEKHGEAATIVKLPVAANCSGYGCIPAPGKPAIPFKNWPLRDQGDLVNQKTQEAYSGTEPGALYLNLKSKDKPGLVDQNNADIIDKTVLYSGCYARAAVNAFWYEQKGNKGVSFGLQALQKVKEGEVLGARQVKAQDAFEPVAMENEAGDGTSMFS